MGDWDGSERRKMSQQEIQRDRLLTEVHNDMKHVVKWTEEHDRDDKQRFADVNNKLLYGAIALIIVAFASGVLGQLLNHVKVGI
jgi:hypothetical protein